MFGCISLTDHRGYWEFSLYACPCLGSSDPLNTLVDTVFPLAPAPEGIMGMSWCLFVYFSAQPKARRCQSVQCVHLATRTCYLSDQSVHSQGEGVMPPAGPGCAKHAPYPVTGVSPGEGIVLAPLVKVAQGSLKGEGILAHFACVTVQKSINRATDTRPSLSLRYFSPIRASVVQPAAAKLPTHLVADGVVGEDRSQRSGYPAPAVPASPGR